MKIWSVLFITAIVITLTPGIFAPEGASEFMDVNAAYTSRDVIRIDGDEDFDAAHGVTGGSGSENDPYIISGWEIDASGKKVGIYIGNTSKHFKIKNCYVHNAKATSGFFYIGSGIEVKNAANGIIENVRATDNYFNGIVIENSHNIVVRDNTVSGSTRNGIYVDNSPGTIIEGNALEGNDIEVSNSDGSRITENSVTDTGISLSDSKNLLVANNAVTNAKNYGIDLYKVGHSTIRDNEIKDAKSYGIYIRSSVYSNLVDNNTISGSDRGMYIYSSRNVVVSNNSFEKNNYSMYISWVSSARVENNTINGGMYGIYIVSTSSSEVKYNTLRKNYESIHVEKSDGNVLEKNSCLGDGTAFTRDGIYLKSSEHLTIRGNHCSWLSYGIDLYASENVTVENNTLDHNSKGIALASRSNHTTLRGNHLYENDKGMNVEYSSYLSVNNNTFSENNVYGLYIITEYSHIEDNKFLDNFGGIIVDHSGMVFVERNRLEGNTWGIKVLSSHFMYIAYNKFLNHTTFGLNLTSSGVINVDKNEIKGNVDGIELYLVGNVRIGDNSISSNTVGIYLLNSTIVKIEKQKIQDSGKSGVVIRGSEDIIVREMNMSHNGWYGVEIYKSVDVSIDSSDIVQNGKDGLFILANRSFEESIKIRDSRIYENNYGGIYIYGEKYGDWYYQKYKKLTNITIENTSIVKNNYDGILLDGNLEGKAGAGVNIDIINSTLEGNGGNGLKIESFAYYYTHHIAIDGCSIFNNSKDGINALTQHWNYDGFMMYVTNSKIYQNGGSGINIYLYRFLKINWTSIHNNGGDGIWVKRTYISIENNTISSNGGNGITPHDADGKLVNNTVSHNEKYGMHIERVSISEDSLPIKILGNTVYGNGEDGIWIKDSRFSMLHNTISYNMGNGTTICYESFDLEGDITENLFLNNTGYGIAVFGDRSPTLNIHGNSFYYNHGSNDTYDSSHIQAYDDLGATWNSDYGGNFWYDWTEPDRDGDGIVDEPYVLDGGSGSKDYYPLAESDVPIPELSWTFIVLLGILTIFLIKRK